MINHFKSGSLWRKWDLHVHTPETKLNDQYRVDPGKNVWDIFCEKIENSDVDVFGITDYFSIDGYNKFSDEFKKRYSKSHKVFFPNIEFRIESKNHNGDHIQIHVIFSNKKMTLDKIPNFLTRLKLVSTDNETLNNKYCTSTDLSSVTYEKAMVTLDSLVKSLQADFTNEEFLIVGVATGYGSLRPSTGKDGRGAEYAKEIDKICHLFFGNKNNTELFLNKIAGRSQYSLPKKAVVSGCDSHSFEVLDKKLGKSFEENEEGKIKDYSDITWVKANTTFEGLRQVIFEPEERVKIQELIPDEKEIYRTIKSVVLYNSKFTSEEIFLNPNLNVIIGSRSSGKTSLLNAIAKSIDENQFSERNSELATIDPPEAKVIWSDDTESGLENIKGVVYIPQNYINSLAEAEKSDDPILKIAENAFGDDLIEKRDEVDAVISQINLNINGFVHKLFSLSKQILDQAEKVKKIGDKKGVEKQIQKITKEVEKLQKDLSKEDLKNLETIRKTYSDYTKELEFIKLDIDSLTSVRGGLNDEYYPFNDFDIEIRSEELRKEVELYTEKSQKEYKESYSAFLNLKIEELTKKEKGLDKEKKKLLEENKDLINKSKNNKSAEEKIKELAQENKKLLDIEKEEKVLTSLKESREKVTTDLLEHHLKRFNTRKEFSQSITGNIDGIEFSGNMSIENKKLSKFLENNVNFHNSSQESKQYLNSIGFRSDDLASNINIINPSNIKNVLQLILDDSLKLKSGIDTQRAVQGLFDDYSFINYTIKYEDDLYSEMTPGKKSLVVLKLLIEASDGKYPILIDQPEDDLDSRSISNEIVNFIRNKKKDRQIIVVTHNANIAIKADAEEIIVANRHGQESKNKNDIVFDYISGSIENSFVDEKAAFTLEKMGIREHACELLEGGEEAFENRRNKYNLK
ncbi:MAG: hypothetical protein QG614_528 [Patescibacteria group bacterium]|nr:hypothetical protein [Patescibacteria group bacterium]